MSSARGPALRTACLRVAAVVALACSTRGSSAAPGAAPGAGCNDRHVTALGQVACELARALPSSAASTLVVATPVRTELRAGRLTELGARLTGLLAGELGANARSSDRVIPPGELYKLGARDTRLVVIHVELARDALSATADVVAGLPRFWERTRGVAPGTAAHAFARRALDAELQSYLPPIPLVVSRIDKAGPSEDPSIALACGDADAEPGLELVSVGRHRVQIGRLESGRFTVLRSKPWSELAEIAPSPLREPLASAVVPAPGSVEIGISDRAAAVRLDRELRVVARFADRAPWPGGGCAAFEALAFSAVRAPCQRRAPSDAGASLVDAIAGARVARSDGSLLEVYAARRQRDSRVEVSAGARRFELTDVVGAQLALADLDADGRAELITSNDSADPALDFIRVRTLNDDGSFADAFQVPVPTGVRALTTCPREGEGLSPIVAATGDGFWVLR